MDNQPPLGTKEKDSLSFDLETVVGLKFEVGPVDLKDMDPKEFVENIGFKFKLPEEVAEVIEDESGVFTGENKMTCKFFDDQEGIMYVHFDKEVKRKDLYMFEDPEIIYKKIV